MAPWQILLTVSREQISMNNLIVDLEIPREKYLTLYQGYIKHVKAVARNGQTVRFPASVLQPFVTHEGIHGTFCIFFDADHKFKSMERV